jgi:hypothetical protein
MRNELVEELIVDPEKKAMENRMGNSSETTKPMRWRAKRADEKTSRKTRA